MQFNKLELAIFIIFSLCFYCNSISAQQKDPVTLCKKEKDALEEALKCLNMTIDDLSYEKKYVQDEFRLRIVDELLDKPLKTPDFADEVDKIVLSKINKPSELICFISEKLDDKFDNKKLPKVKHGLYKNIISDEQLKNIPDEIAVELKEVISTFIITRDNFDEALKDLNSREREDIILAIQKMLLNKKTDFEYFDIQDAKLRFDELDTNVVFRLSKKVDFKKIYSSSANFFKTFEKFIDAIRKNKFEVRDCVDEGRKKLFGVSGDVLICLETSYGRIVIGGAGKNFYTRSQFLIIDFGGDDVYRFENGDTAIKKFDATNCSIIVDCAGDDYYETKSSFNLGTGIFGIGIMFDLSGNDVYISKNFSLGCGFFGVGLIKDYSGDDIYKSDTITQGAGLFGIGLMIDGNGSDKYNACLFSQGFGFVKGWGGLMDVDGNDLYYAGGKYTHEPLLPEQFQSLSQGFGFGMRYSNVSGGIGLLWDNSGNDYYNADVYGQGASYWFSLGMLIDNSGHDNYGLIQYGQGAGIHLSAGILVDRFGFDHYFCRNGVAQGCGHDLAVGFLFDKSGDDYYQGSGLTQGASNANGIGILIESAGNDGYSGLKDEIQGFSFTARNTIGIAVLLDLSGQDNYSKEHKNNSYWIKGTYGIGVDKETENK